MIPCPPGCCVVVPVLPGPPPAFCASSTADSADWKSKWNRYMSKLFPGLVVSMVVTVASAGLVSLRLSIPLAAAAAAAAVSAAEGAGVASTSTPAILANSSATATVPLSSSCHWFSSC
eukprot:CAMPEP_0174990874 /NCGR_PEP_ID=MMETSP0004_2-20121128/21563_1 /TAXON_ID=420556 /ORGANISM="Ochromonas sp., Strain CCMP1393" /LENGTH=117 /DNA_ID=CAMNT_0016244529 /DNA_START=497 /DNA_END=850 /DNA_ORIENTATION=-